MNTSEGQLRLSGLKKKVREVHFRSFGHMLNMELLGNKKKRKTEKIHGCYEGGHAES